MGVGRALRWEEGEGLGGRSKVGRLGEGGLGVSGEGRWEEGEGLGGGGR